MLIDSHCHLDFDELKPRLDEVLTNAKNSGVNIILCACSYIKDFEGIVEIANNNDNLYASIGQHPFDIKDDFSMV
jgi:TatD DNase family protein